LCPILLADEQSYCVVLLSPNAAAQPRLEAGAQRTLKAVGWTRTPAGRLCPSPSRAPCSSRILSWSPLCPLPCRIDRQRSSPQRGPVQSINGGLCLSRIRHLDKPKAPRTAGVAILQDLYASYRPIGMKELREVFFRGRKREVADKDIH